MMKVCPPGQMTGKEAERHVEALGAAPSFADAHLVTQPVQPVTGKGGWVVMFQDVAGGSLRTMRPLSTMRGDLPRDIATIVRSILSEWNPTAKTTKKARPVLSGAPRDEARGGWPFGPVHTADRVHTVHRRCLTTVGAYQYRARRSQRRGVGAF